MSLIRNREDVLVMLDDLLQERDGAWWSDFFSDPAKPCPFFVDHPDENLAEWFETGRLRPGRVLELGCGQGRNAVYLAGQGCEVTAVDFSAEALEQARKRATGTTIDFRCSSIFEVDIEAHSYDLVYDSGCFHHIAPHRRPDYLELVERALRPGGSLGMVCFRPEGGGGLTDQQVYEHGGLNGGLGYGEDDLRSLWHRAPFELQVIRQMRSPEGEPRFGLPFLWALLATKNVLSKD